MLTFNEAVLLKLIGLFPFRDKTYYKFCLTEDKFQLPELTGHAIDRLEFLGLIENDVSSLFISRRGELALQEAIQFYKNKAGFLFEDSK